VIHWYDWRVAGSVLSPRSTQTPKKGAKVPAGQAAQDGVAAKKLAISYQRVSTTAQTEETKSLNDIVKRFSFLNGLNRPYLR
tara:strand:+ start:291 stop:536 length:246 start_codon:yes stop_codon:yes gene_type:complete